MTKVSRRKAPRRACNRTGGPVAHLRHQPGGQLDVDDVPGISSHQGTQPSDSVGVRVPEPLGVVPCGSGLRWAIAFLRWQTLRLRRTRPSRYRIGSTSVTLGERRMLGQKDVGGSEIPSLALAPGASTDVVVPTASALPHAAEGFAPSSAAIASPCCFHCIGKRRG